MHEGLICHFCVTTCGNVVRLHRIAAFTLEYHFCDFLSQFDTKVINPLTVPPIDQQVKRQRIAELVIISAQTGLVELSGGGTI